MNPNDNRTFRILLVEDNEGDAFLIRKALKDSGYGAFLHVVPDGSRAIEFLRGVEEQVPIPIPDLIILDLMLPVRDGYGVLEEIKNDPRLKTIPLVVFTGSSAPEDVKRAYTLGANSYVVKPIGFNVLQKSLRIMLGYWFGLASLPTNPDM